MEGLPSAQRSGKHPDHGKRQFIDVLPVCAQICASYPVGCASSSDFNCICRTNNYLEAIYNCMKGQCTASEQQVALEIAVAVCRSVGVELSINLPTATGFLNSTGRSVTSTTLALSFQTRTSATQAVTGLSLSRSGTAIPSGPTSGGSGLPTGIAAAPSGGGLRTGAKAGIAVGASLGFIALLVGAVFLWYRRRPSRKGEHFEEKKRVELAGNSRSELEAIAQPVSESNDKIYPPAVVYSQEGMSARGSNTIYEPPPAHDDVLPTGQNHPHSHSGSHQVYESWGGLHDHDDRDRAYDHTPQQQSPPSVSERHYQQYPYPNPSVAGGSSEPEPLWQRPVTEEDREEEERTAIERELAAVRAEREHIKRMELLEKKERELEERLSRMDGAGGV